MPSLKKANQDILEFVQHMWKTALVQMIKVLVILKGQSKKQVQVNNMWINALIHMVKVLSLWNKIERALSSVSFVLKLHEQSVEMDGWHVKCQKAVNSMC